MSRIKEIAPKEDYKLEVQFENGSSVILNMENRLQTIRFGMLADKDFFNSAVTDGTYIRWKNKIEISTHELFQLMQK